MSKETMDNISQIRKIVLGDEILAYKNKFKTIETEFSQKINQLQSSLDQIEVEILHDLNSAIKSNNEDSIEYINQCIDQLQDTHHKLIYKKFEHSKGYIKTLRTEFTNYQKKINEKFDKLKLEMKNINEQQKNFVTKKELSDFFSGYNKVFKSKTNS